MRRRIAAAVLGLVLAVASVAPAARADQSPGFSDLHGHWAEPLVLQAVQSGFVNGYPDGRFQPDRPITRAEYVKMLVAAGHLPAADLQIDPLPDTQGHWLYTQGYLARALSSYTVSPYDYRTGFNPDQPIPRQEMAILAERMLGHIAVAQGLAGTDLPLADKAAIPDGARGWVKLALDDKILAGYPDNTFRGDLRATRAEAIVVIMRTLMAMNLGTDPGLHLVVNGQAVTPDVPLAVHGGLVYVPIQWAYGQNGAVGWYDPGRIGDTTLDLGAANDTFHYEIPRLELPVGGTTWVERTPVGVPATSGQLLAGSYLVRGQLMIPAAPVGGDGTLPFGQAHHDAATHTLRITTQPWPGNNLPATAAQAKLAFPGAQPTQVAPGGELRLRYFLPTDSLGFPILPNAPMLLHCSVDATTPLRLHAEGGKDGVNIDLGPDGSGFPGVGYLHAPAGTPAGTYNVSCAMPGIAPASWAVHVAAGAPAP